MAVCAICNKNFDKESDVPASRIIGLHNEYYHVDCWYHRQMKKDRETKNQLRRSNIDFHDCKCCNNIILDDNFMSIIRKEGQRNYYFHTYCLIANIKKDNLDKEHKRILKYG